MLTVLIGLSVIKAALIIAYFMHLKFERFSLFLTLFPMLIFCIVLMLIFMPDSMRLAIMRVAMKRLAGAAPAVGFRGERAVRHVFPHGRGAESGAPARHEQWDFCHDDSALCDFRRIPAALLAQEPDVRR